MRKILLLLVVCITFLGLQGAFAQGSTTSSLSGVVKDTNGEPIPGATIIAVHTPTGSQFGNASGANGNFIIRNMNVGGPYKITVSFVGFQDQVKDGVYLNLGQTLNLSFQMSEEATELSEVVITGSRAGELIDGERTGAETNVSEDMLGNLPNVSRSLNDFTRLTPQASVADNGALSIAGTNNRYNAIFIDGAVNNDVFGLSPTGANGGQTGISPISVDAIDQIQVLVSPYDVTKGGFAGGGINAVTRSGSNKFEGSAYYLVRNQDLAGKTPTNVSETDRKKLDKFTARTYGFRLGGALKKNKLFFFVNAEIQRDENPQPFDFKNYTGDITKDQVDRFVSKLKGYGYDPGGYEGTTDQLDGEKFLIKLDWNINKTHKLSVRHSYTKGVNTDRRTSSARSIAFANSGILFPSTTNSSTIELKSNFGNNSNNLIFGYTSVRDDRDPIGGAFPYIYFKNDRGITAGSEQYSTANLLNQDIFTLTDNFVMFKGKHTWTVGTHNEFYKIRNVFIRQNFGSYRWNSLDDFLNDEAPIQFDRSFSLVGGGLGDDTNAAAEFNAMQLGFYAQDEIQMNDKFKLTAGLRVDIPIFTSQPTENKLFNNETIPLLKAAGQDLQGAKTGQAPKATLMFAPRVGFNYDMKGDQSTQIRGGLGIFTSRVPFVWPGGMYNNNGTSVGGVRQFSDITFEPDVNKQPPVVDPNNIQPSGQIDLFAKDFKYPQVLRTSLAVDQKLPWGLVGTAEVIFTKTLNNVFYQNLNLKKSTESFEGPDNRPIFNRRDPIDGTYTYIMLGSNTNKGYTINTTLQIQKPFSNGMTASIAYNYGDARAIFDGTSSQNNSQWRNSYSLTGRNNAGLGRSDFSQGSRITAFLSYRKEYLGFAATTVTFFLNAQSGNPFSYVYNRDIGNEDSRSYSLVYVPKTSSDIELVDITDRDGNVTSSAAEQWTALDNFIKNDDYLSTRRGDYAEKNGSRTPFTTVLDFKLKQDFFLKTGDGTAHTFQVGLDIFNFTNFLNKDWGRRYYSSFGQARLLSYQGTKDGTNIPTYTFNTNNKTADDFFTADNSGLTSSRWQMQLSLRYSF